MIQIRIFNEKQRPDEAEKEKIISFLFDNLQDYGDPKPDIEKAVDYALMLGKSFGGVVLTANLNEKIVGAVVLNKTGMKDYIPENILVYIATDKNERGKGIGKMLMEKTLNLSEGSVALHVEPDNPARKLYEKLGFNSKYIEMRYKKLV
jgi:[ribosomal protein S18]-alanine N-acetyltransferase